MTAAADPGAWSRGVLDRCDDHELVHKVQLLPRASAEREAACEVLIVRYQPLVRSCALRYREAPETTEELMQAGYVGLLKAISNFDPAIGTNLAVYAQPCITGEIKRHFRDTRWQVHVKRSAQELRLAARKAAPELAQDLSRTPRDDELARHLKVSEKDIADARQAERVFQTMSLDAPLAGCEQDSLADLMGDEDTQIEHTVQMQAVLAHWTGLPAREQASKAPLPHGAFVEHIDLVVVHGPFYQPARACEQVPARARKCSAVGNTAAKAIAGEYLCIGASDGGPGGA